MKTEILLNKIKKTVRKIDNSAEIYLFGSRARKNFKKNSDWDFLIVTHEHFNYNLRQRILNQVYNLELEYNAIINTIIVDKDEWNNSLNKVTPFYKNVQAESIRI